jgi:hypothetical protein
VVAVSVVTADAWPPVAAHAVSNTKVKLFTAYGEACKSYGGLGNDAVSKLDGLDPEQGCDLAFAHDLTCTLADQVSRVPHVHNVHGVVTTVEKASSCFRPCSSYTCNGNRSCAVMRFLSTINFCPTDN